MLKRLIKIQLIVGLVLAGLYVAAFWPINSDQQNQEDRIQNQASAPDGKKYMPYCGGGLSEILIEASDSSCLAEKPGDFAKFAFALYATIAFLITPLFGYLYLYISNLRKRQAAKAK